MALERATKPGIPARRPRLLAAACLLCLASTAGAQTQGGIEPAAWPPAEDDFDDSFEETTDYDPFERWNRAVFEFNKAVDDAVMRPVARAYTRMMPDPLEKGVSNFFSNLNDLGSAANHLLQGDINYMFADLSRFIINSSVGLLGFFDVASRNGIPKHGEDFGQTLGVWGFDTGPYLVLPFLGPSSGRDAVGLAGDFFMFDPLVVANDDGIYWGAVTLRYVDRRAAFLEATDIAEQAALDPYIFYREAYLQRRAAQVRDGSSADDF